MQHLDEGTIHAWLDGALDGAEAARVEAHVAECATCAAAVAEARGLIAGASRVLSALDHAPANVIPSGLKGGGGIGGATPDETAASMGEPGVVSLGARRSRWKRFHMTPARIAAAAVIVVAAGSLLVAREGVTLRQYRSAPVASRSGPGPRVQEQLPSAPLPSPVGSADSISTSTAKVEMTQLVDSTAARQKLQAAAMPPVEARARNAEIDLSKKVIAREAKPSAANDVASNASPGAVSGGASGAVAASPSAPVPQPVQLRQSPQPMRTEQVVTSLKDSARSAKMRISDSVVASKDANQRAAASAASSTEVYARERADSASVSARRPVASEARGRAAVAAPRAFDAPSSGTTGCYERAVATSDSLVPRRFVLDTLRYALRDGGDAHAVTIPGESTTLPRGYWRIAGGAVQVVWNDNAWPTLTIVPSVAASITAIVNKSPMISVSLRRCDGGGR